MVVRTTTLPISQTTAFKSQKHPFHILDASPFPFLTGLFLATLLVPLTFSMHGVDLLAHFSGEGITFFMVPLTPQAVSKGYARLKTLRASIIVGPLFSPAILWGLAALLCAAYLTVSAAYVLSSDAREGLVEEFGALPQYPLLICVALSIAFISLAFAYAFGVVSVEGKPTLNATGNGYLSRKVRAHTPFVGAWSLSLARRILRNLRASCFFLVFYHVLAFKFLFVIYGFLWVVIAFFNRLLRYLNPGTPGKVLQYVENLRTELWSGIPDLWNNPQPELPDFMWAFLLSLALVGAVCHRLLTKPQTAVTEHSLTLLLFLLSPIEFTLLSLVAYFLERTIFPTRHTIYSVKHAGLEGSKSGAALEEASRAVSRSIFTNQTRLGLFPVPRPTAALPGSGTLSLSALPKQPDHATIMKRSSELTSLRSSQTVVTGSTGAKACTLTYANGNKVRLENATEDEISIFARVASETPPKPRSYGGLDYLTAFTGTGAFYYAGLANQRAKATEDTHGVAGSGTGQPGATGPTPASGSTATTATTS